MTPPNFFKTVDAPCRHEQFIADCQARSGSEEVYQQSYMCNPLGAATASIVEWSAIKRCRFDYQIERVHLESDQIIQRFGEFSPANESARENQIHQFLRENFPSLFSDTPRSGHSALRTPHSALRLGFDVAASGQGNLAAFYIDEPKDSALWLRALLTARTEDWHFLKTVLFHLLRHLPGIQAAGDESGLGRQICWEAASEFSSRFLKVNFASKKHDLGFSLMNQLSVAEKRFPKSHQDIAADYFALRKVYTGTRWVFNEGRNTFNPASPKSGLLWNRASTFATACSRRSQSGILPGLRCLRPSAQILQPRATQMSKVWPLPSPALRVNSNSQHLPQARVW